MKKLFAVLLCATFVFGEIAVFHLQASAKAMADQRAEELLRAARVAIGGDSAINAVTNLLINGRVTHSVKTSDNQERQLEGNLEMALELPDKLHKKMTLGTDANALNLPEGARKFRIERADVIAHGELKAGEAGSPEKFQKRIRSHHGDELARLAFGLLLKASPALNAVYNYLGEGNVDGAAANIIEATNAEGFSVKLYLDKNSNLPLAMSYRSVEPPTKIFLRKKAGEDMGGEHDLLIKRGELPAGAHAIEQADGTRIIIRKKDENGDVITSTGEARSFEIKLEPMDVMVKFSDYRSVNGLMLPHNWTKTVNGGNAETITINSYEVNAPNLAEKFKGERQFTFRTREN